VLQHVVDPVGFLSDISRHLSPNGRVVFILPDAEEPSCEMLWCDHNFSFRATELAVLAEKANLRVTLWQPNPANNSLLNKQLVVLCKKDQKERDADLPRNRYSIEELFDRRSQYIMSWRCLNAELAREVSEYDRVFNFGSSMWTWHLAGNCPYYWSQVTACLVDGEHGECIGKTVLPTGNVSFGSTDCVVLGVNPVNQAFFAERLSGSGARVITWSNRVTI
jgi:SAM-dependent methyltransferase